MKYKFAALAAAFAGMTLLGAAPAYADEEEDARARADVRAADRRDRSRLRPSFNWRGKLFQNRRRSSTAAPAARPATSPTSSSTCTTSSHETWKLERASQGRGVAERRRASVNVPVVVHVINKGTGIANGDVPQSQIDAQMTVLNDAYAATGSPFFFTLAERHPHHQRDLVRA